MEIILKEHLNSKPFKILNYEDTKTTHKKKKQLF